MPHLSVGVRNFEWFLQDGKFGLLHELDGIDQEFRAVVHTQFNVGNLWGNFITFVTKIVIIF